MATAAQVQPTPTTTDPVQRCLARRGAGAQSEAQGARPTPQNEPGISPRRAPFCASPPERTGGRVAAPNKRGTSAAAAPEASPLCANSKAARRAAINRANSQHSAGPRTEPGKRRSSLNALRHGLTAQTAVLPTEDPEAYQRHIQQFLDEYAPATPTETQLVHEIANTAWRLNRIPLLEAELFSHPPSPQTPIPLLATLGLHSSRLSRQFQKAVDKLRDIQAQRVRRTPFCASSLKVERRRLTEAAEIFMAISTKDFPGIPPTIFRNKLASFFQKRTGRRVAAPNKRGTPQRPTPRQVRCARIPQKNKSSATHHT